MGEVSIIGLDLAKNVFQAHGAAADGAVVIFAQSSRAADQRQGSSRQGRAGSSCRWSSVESPVKVGVSNQTLPEHRR